MTDERKIAIKLRDAAIRKLRTPDFTEAKNVTIAVVDQLIKEMPTNTFLLEIKIELKKL